MVLDSKDHKACDTQSNYRDLKKVHLNPIIQ